MLGWGLIGWGAANRSYWMIPLGAALIGLQGLYKVICDMLFPIAMINIGDGKIRAERVSRRRATAAALVFVAVGLGLVVNILAARVYQALFGGAG